MIANSHFHRESQLLLSAGMSKLSQAETLDKVPRKNGEALGYGE